MRFCTVRAFAIGITLLFVGGARLQAVPVSGAVFTTGSSCDGTNLNIFTSKDAVFLDGGPAHPGAAGLPDGLYYVKVTEPNGTLLGISVGTPVHVTNGSFDTCYQLSAILIKASDSTPGYDTTTNGGGEYKVWVSSVSTFDNDATKTDNFKVQDASQTCTSSLRVHKYYDLNANGVYDPLVDPEILGWVVRIQDGMDLIRETTASVVVAPDTYTVTEAKPVEASWMSTSPTSQTVTLNCGDCKDVNFLNVCLGPCGAYTLGFWSNKNGQKIMTGSQTGSTLLPAVQILLRSLNLRNANGTYLYTNTTTAPTTETITYSTFRTWILSASATNMAYMLSAQLAAMELNAKVGGVVATELIYAPGTNSANTAGFATVNAVMAEAVASLGANGYTVASGSVRTTQEALKNALDKANNNLTFVQPGPCPFTFANPPFPVAG